MKKTLLQKQIRKKWEKSGIQISKELRDILHGYIMSDGYISFNGSLMVGHSIKQKLFVQWLYNKVYPISTSYPAQQKTVIHCKTKKSHTKITFNTRNHFLLGFRHMWYEKKKNERGKYQKKLPNSIECFFNETFISVWFAGDGTKTIGYRGAKFEVTAFTIEDRLKLKKLFLTKFNIQTKIISSGVSKKGNPQWALVIPAHEYSKFRQLITKIDLIPTLFPYKLHKK